MEHITDCAECARLWREYSLSTTAHLKLESKLKVAALRYETDVIPDLTHQVENAALKRSADREAIRVHEQARHSGADGNLVSLDTTGP